MISRLVFVKPEAAVSSGDRAECRRRMQGLRQQVDFPSSYTSEADILHSDKLSRDVARLAAVNFMVMPAKLREYSSR